MKLFDTNKSYSTPDGKETIPSDSLTLYLTAEPPPPATPVDVSAVNPNIPPIPSVISQTTFTAVQTQKTTKATLNAQPVLILPFPDGKTKLDNKTNSVNVLESKPIWDTNDVNQTYDHTGFYKASASSVYTGDGVNYQPGNAFNISDYGWKSAENPGLTQSTIYNESLDELNTDKNTYSKVHYGPSYYNGIATTTVQQEIFSAPGYQGKSYGEEKIAGEWLQIQLPKGKPVYLFRYKISVPRPPNNNYVYPPTDKTIPNQPLPPPKENSSFFPKTFVVVGSKDGNSWFYVDQQTFIEPPDISGVTGLGYPNLNYKKGYRKDPLDNNAIVFDINSVNRYTYYRIIITELFPGMTAAQISQWQLYAFADIITPNARTLVESFSPNYVKEVGGMTSKPLGEPFSESHTISPELQKKHNDQLTSIQQAKLYINPLSTVEGFDSHGFVSYPSGTTNGNLVINNQLAPMAAIYSDYINQQKKVNNNYFDLSQNIAKFNKEYSLALYAQNDKYDMSGNNFNRPPTIMDGWINDNREIVLQQNSMFILSSITIATLILALIFAGR